MTKRKEMSAAQFMVELRDDPDVAARQRVTEEGQASRSREFALILEPMLAELSDVEYNVLDLNDLVERYAPLPDQAVQILLAWLPKIQHPALKEQIVRSLGASAAPFNGAALASTFETTSSEPLRWAIANTIAEAKPSGLEQWLVGALSNERYGKAREMLLIATSRLMDPKEARALILPFLVQMPLHAALALAESGGPHELEVLKKRLRVVKGVERKEFESAIRKIRKRLV